MTKEIKTQDNFVIEDLDTLKVISDGLRMQILDKIGLANRRGALRTVKELAAELDLPPQKLYYHINMLEKHGFVQVAETQIVSGIVEKHYRVQAKNITISRQLFESGLRRDEKARAALGLLDSVFEATRLELVSLIEKSGDTDEQLPTLRGRRGHISRDTGRLTAEQAEAFYGRLLELIDEFADFEPEEGESHVYTLTTVLLPTARSD